MKKALKKIVPGCCVRAYGMTRVMSGFLCDVWYDVSRYARHSTLLKRPLTPGQAKSWITAAGHVVEKAMTLPEPRVGFGQPHVRELLSVLRQWSCDACFVQSVEYQSAVGSIQRYLEFHKERQHPVPEIAGLFQEIQGLATAAALGGTKSVSREDVQAAAVGDFEALAHSRSSVRAFSGEPVDVECIARAIRLAQRSPSACNRQCSRVYVVRDPVVKRKTLALQNGNRGFGESADVLLVVAAEIESFYGSPERNQAFIDGGLFSMSLLFGLHYVGLGACPLAWCVPRKNDRELRKVLPLRDSETVIMLIAVGRLRERFDVAMSTRKNTEEITHWIDG